MNGKNKKVTVMPVLVEVLRIGNDKAIAQFTSNNGVQYSIQLSADDFAIIAKAAKDGTRCIFGVTEHSAGR